MRNINLLAGVACVFALTLGAHAQEPFEVYSPSHFERFAPRTALDMVRRVPAFTLPNQGGGDGARGFGQAADNLLINGRRLSGKSNSVTDALDRIPAVNVERIEVLDGASLDIPGLSGQVVNVVAEVSAVSGVWQYRARFREGVRPFYDGVEVSATGRREALTWTLGLEIEPRRSAAAGREDVFNAEGQLAELRDESRRFVGARPALSTALTWERASGAVTNLNGQIELFSGEDKEFSLRRPQPGGLDRSRTFKWAEDEIFGEIGVDHEFDVGPGRLKLIGLGRHEHSPVVETVDVVGAGGVSLEAEVFEETLNEGEGILRAEYGWSRNEVSDWRVSLEGAFNFLDSISALFIQDELGALGPVSLANPDTHVEEARVEGFLTYGRSFSPQLTAQAGLGVELSQITQSDDIGESRSFTRPKGFVSASYDASDTLDVSLRLERVVGQLDFSDFVSSVNLDLANATSGNPQIVPQQSWRADLTLERDLGVLGAATLTLYGEAIEDIIENVPVGPFGEGPGNLDSASLYGAELISTLELERFGWQGARLEFEGEWRSSSVEDPLTGADRRINEDLISRYDVNLRHDLTGGVWAWGAGLEYEREAPSVRLDQITEEIESPPFAFVWLEHKNLRGMTGRVAVGNVLDQDVKLTRRVFDPQNSYALSRFETRDRNFGTTLTVRLEGSF